MGMFTSVVHPDDGRELQIKCGNDDCERYHVGDTVNWFIRKERPKSGKLLDGVYQAYDDDFVVIKDHKIVAVVPFVKCTEECYDENDRRICQHDTEQSLCVKFDIKELPDSAWSEEGWARKREQEAKYKKEWEEYEAKIAHITDAKERLAAVMAYPLTKMINWKSYAQQFLSVELFDKENKNDNV